LNKKEKNLLYSGNLWYLAEGMFGPLFAVFADKVGGNILSITYAWATYLVISGFLTIFVGRIASRFKIDAPLMVLGYFLQAIILFSYIWVDSQTKLLIVQAGLGIAAALSNPTWHALYAKHENRKLDSYIWGLAAGGFKIMMGIAIVIGGYIVTHFSFNALFITMGSIQVIATIYQARILRMK
jgi:predicted MFS family arabinose efflux permease